LYVKYGNEQKNKEMQSQFFRDKLEAGCDEAGRGCLAGPVVAAAVILKQEVENELINDSKILSEKTRLSLKTWIEENSIAWAVAYVEPIKIDEINILNASILAMHIALEQLKIAPEHILVDGNRFKPYKEIPHQCIVKGDSKYRNIAAASILAKTYRDDYMGNLHIEFPHYNWKKNKGYPTAEHREGIKKFGITVHHRKSFRLLPSQLELDL